MTTHKKHSKGQIRLIIIRCFPHTEGKTYQVMVARRFRNGKVSYKYYNRVSTTSETPQRIHDCLHFNKQWGEATSWYSYPEIAYYKR